MSDPKAFISYSWDNEDHKAWVRILATKLQANGIYVSLDQWDTHPGIDLTTYMESSVRESDYVLLICTPRFANRANIAKGGVGYEKIIVTGEIFTGSSIPKKFVPILRKGEPDESLPSYLKSRLFIDFRDDAKFSLRFEELLRHLHGIPRFERPPIGNKPQLSKSELIQPDGATGSGGIIFCKNCGNKPGGYSSCIGGNAHDYKRYIGNIDLVFCAKCGSKPSGYSSCIGGNKHLYEQFDLPKGSIFCTKCGQNPGSYSSCIGSLPHNFELI